jgi:hypothetical protein
MINLAIEWAETMSGKFSFVDMDPTDFRKITNWLKSLHPQPTQEWSEEDEKMLDAMIDIVSGTFYEPLCPRKEMLSWLKSLRPSWKPSEEQMEALKNVIRITSSGKNNDLLRTLFIDLEKLI